MDSAPPMVISAATSDPKRRRGNNVGISMEEDIPMPGPSGTAHVGVPITQPTNHTGVSSVPLTALPGLPNAQELVKKRRKPRKPVRKLPVTLRRYNIWERLNSIDAGLTMGDWIYLDQEARRDLVDGARTMSAKSKKVVLNGKFKTITVEPGSKGKKRSNAQIVNAVEQWNDGIESGYDSSEWEDESDDSSVFSTEGSATTDTEITNASLIKYPYNLQKMRSSSPLKGPVSVNGVVFDCTFDSGASISVMNEGLAQKLGLTYNGDRMHIVGFDALKREACDIAVNVPFMVAGHLRPEHICIHKDRTPGEADYCLLGTTWFRAYGVSLDLHDHTISFPVNIARDANGELMFDPSLPRAELQVYSTHESDNSVASLLVEPSVVGTSRVLAVRVALADTDSPGGDLLNYYIDDVYSATDDGVSTKDNPALDLEAVPDYLKDLITEYAASFVEISGLGRTDMAEHEIPTLPGKTPIKSKPFRLSWEEQDSMAREIEEMMKLNLIRPSKGVWSSPCFFVRKKDGSLRLVIDYRRLNKITIKDNFPLPIIDSLLDSLGGAKIFTTLDAASGYHQIPMHKDSMAKTGFITPQGTFEFQVMPFGLTSAPATYQRTMTNLLGEYIGKFVFVFIDDIIVFSTSAQEHATHLKLVLDRCNQANLRLKYKKCTFGATEVEYLGHTISASGITPNLHNSDKVLNFPVPRNADDVRSFLGTAGYYRRFIEGYANKSLALTSLLRKNQRFTWGPDQELAFKTLKEDLTKAPVLAYPDRCMVMILTTDASKVGLGAVLSQSPTGSEDGERVVSYNSRTLRGAELNYATVHLEALAVIWGISKYKHFLRGRKFMLRTDNAALTYILAPSKPSPKLSRWAAALLEYDYDIIHQPGKQNPADSLSRLLVANEAN